MSFTNRRFEPHTLRLTGDWEADAYETLRVLNEFLQSLETPQALAITEATLDSSPIGSDEPATGAFTTLSATGNATVGGTLTAQVAVVPVATGSNRNLLASESRTAFTNEGATARQDLTLPAAAANLQYTFYCHDTDGIRIIAGTGDTIRIAGSVSAAAGRIDSTTIGSAVILLAINATEWVALSSVGTWVVT